MRIRRRLTPLQPTPRNRRRIEGRVKWLGLLVRYAFRPVVRTTFGPREPLREPALVLSNHSSLLDPMFLSLAVGRAVHFLSTELAFSGGGWDGSTSSSARCRNASSPPIPARSSACAAGVTWAAP